MSSHRLENITLQAPNITDGPTITELIRQCPPLDINSSYCNLLQCSHFANTSVVAKEEEQVMGFISGYLIPNRQNTLFIWQVAISEQARGMGLASAMLQHLAERLPSQEQHWLETTITDDNKASWSLFEKFAKDKNTALDRRIMFEQQTHFNGEHATEHLVTIGPF